MWAGRAHKTAFVIFGTNGMLAQTRYKLIKYLRTNAFPTAVIIYRSNTIFLFKRKTVRKLFLKSNIGMDKREHIIFLYSISNFHMVKPKVHKFKLLILALDCLINSTLFMNFHFGNKYEWHRL